MSILCRPPVTWELLIAIEPRLQAAQSAEEIGRLVGWSACTRHPVLRTSDAFHVAVDRLLATDQEQPLELGRCA
jgi:hypothetical protein